MKLLIIALIIILIATVVAITIKKKKRKDKGKVDLGYGGSSNRGDQYDDGLNGSTAGRGDKIKD